MIGKFGWTKNNQSRGEIISLLLPNTPPPLQGHVGKFIQLIRLKKGKL
jgi:hypothetical protein